MKSIVNSVSRYAIAIFALAALISQTACKKDEIPEGTIEVNNFIKDYMDAFYLWNTDMPSLDPSKQRDSEKYFYKLLNTDYDHWSYITPDYASLTSSLSGVELSMGYSFQLYQLDDIVIGLVEYVEPNSPADKANISRGDVIYKINNTEITTDNYRKLLSLNSYQLTLGSIDGNYQISERLPSVQLTAVVLNINPVHMDTVYNIGSSKVGYLVYNAFVDEYEADLTTAFAKFKSEQINDLVLDLRYNGGGSVNVARKLASMIGPEEIKGKTMLKSIYNSELTEYYRLNFPTETSLFEEVFDTVPQNLNLSRLFVLTTAGTASASEMIMYTLKPYLDKLYQIGDTTAGKYYASVVIPGPDEKSGPWAIMPIIMKAENADNSISYKQGMLPDYKMKDDYSHQLGDLNEALLSKAVSIITGSSASVPSAKSAQLVQNATCLTKAKAELSPNKFKMWKDMPTEVPTDMVH